MRAGQTHSTMAETVHDTARNVAETVNKGVRETTTAAAETIGQTARAAERSAEAALNHATDVGHDLYKGIANRASDSIAGLDRAVARNPVGALVAALGLGLVLGLLARK